MKYVTIICSQCGNKAEKPVKHYNYAYKHGHKLFCSVDCNNKSKIRSKICSCAQCGKEVTKTFSAIARSQNGNIFCNRVCATIFNNTWYKSGKNNANYKHGRTGYRNKVEIIACNRCGYNQHPSILEVHHKDRNRENNTEENLEVLCPNCHTVEHRVITNAQN